MTKPCKSCKEQIDEAATKCPRCQAYQHWYRNPQWLTLVFVLPLLLFIFRDRPYSTSRPTFADYKDKIVASIMREDQSAAGIEKGRLFTVRLENRSDKIWKRPKFQIESFDGSGRIITVENLSDFNLVLMPNSSAMVTLCLRLIPSETVVSRKVTVTDLDSDRF